eukprot:3003835-Prymnesium_polylepis.1
MQARPSPLAAPQTTASSDTLYRIYHRGSGADGQSQKRRVVYDDALPRPPPTTRLRGRVTWLGRQEGGRCRSTPSRVLRYVARRRRPATRRAVVASGHNLGVVA